MRSEIQLIDGDRAASTLYGEGLKPLRCIKTTSRFKILEAQINIDRFKFVKQPSRTQDLWTYGF